MDEKKYQYRYDRTNIYLVDGRGRNRFCVYLINATYDLQRIGEKKIKECGYRPQRGS